MNWSHLFYVVLGSAIGGGLRFAIQQFHQMNTTNPNVHYVPILIVNLVGSFAIGAAFAFLLKDMLPPKVNVFFLTGLLGGFTTFSSFTLDMLRIIQRGELTLALAYGIGSLVLGLVAVAIGFWLVNSVIVK